MAESIIKTFGLFNIAESKLNSTFSIRGCKIFRSDHNRFGGGAMLYINENISCKPLSDHPAFSDMDLMTIEVHQNKRRWLFLGIYKPPSQSDNYPTNKLSFTIDHYLPKYENLILIGDFNLPTENSHLDAVIHAYKLNNFISKPTCTQPNNTTCIDLILTNRKNLFKLSVAFETGLSDNHKLVSTILKSGSFKGRPKIKMYRTFKIFNIENFNSILQNKLENLSNDSYFEFEKSF